ncbi:uncharacterized protein Z518_08580 [Rhinocladiella mackenziei CBS 650.93]|uniref:Large ribosomal subunit protein uL29m n=1 Tax=Rhinocladiella mackenziei CBS 650.93 TaxID=1442369 RepID=A0A0D2GWN1_9EURO|nr:uncharacterized protein Z518_08580 [Rhinocladiella mackenziei CBS 650.93]KIX02638.1 hypothetical protein Z518_08580 [Rhinocladiella mackenziei CBS 650.93]
MASLSRTFSHPSTTTVPVFLAPAFARPTTVAATASCSRTYASKPHSQRPIGDRNKQRGVSAIRRTGPRNMRGLWKYTLPVPVARDHRTTDPEYLDTKNHGLWGFFNEARQPMMPPDEESSHGRPWTYQELCAKSFEDLHALYWVCIKEQNRTLTREKERQRVRAGYGAAESEDRVETIRKTMYLIREVLADRQMSYEEAHVMIKQRPIRDILRSEEREEDDVLDFEDFPTVEGKPTSSQMAAAPVSPP